MRLQNVKVTFLAVLLLCIAPYAAQASVVITYTGTVDQFNFGPFTRGSAITGEIVLDTSVTPTEFGGNYKFDNVMASFTLTIDEPGGPLVYTGMGGRVTQHRAAGSDFIGVGLGGLAGGTLSGPTYNGFTPVTFGIDFRAPINTLFADPAVLASNLTEADFNYSFLDFKLDKPGAGVLEKLMVERRLDTVTFSGAASGVPGPAALALLGIGLMAMGMRRRNPVQTDI